MTIKPINDNIILEIGVTEKVEQQSSGIWLINKEQEKKDIGTVVAIGQGRLLNDGTFIKPNIKVGDKVIFDSFAGTEIHSENNKYIIIKENNILGIL